MRMYRDIPAVGAAVGALLALSAGYAQEGDMTSYQQPRGYVCYRASEPILVDGSLDKAVWDAAPWTEDFGDTPGEAGPAPRLRPRAKMLWDAEYLNIPAQLDQPHIWATLTEHDSVIFQDNDFEVFIDPDADSHDYYEIEVNALGAEWDLRLAKPYRDGGPALNDWEIPGLKVGVEIRGTINDASDMDEFWTVELAIPWQALQEYSTVPCPPRPGDQWRVNFSRVEWDLDVEDGEYVKIPDRREHNWVWSPQEAVDMHRPETWGYVQFSTEEPGADTFRPDPTGPARWLLQRVYWAQRDYREEHGAWASDVGQLDLSDVDRAGIEGEPTLRLTDDGWEATLESPTSDGGRTTVHIRQDSKVWTG